MDRRTFFGALGAVAGTAVAAAAPKTWSGPLDLTGERAAQHALDMLSPDPPPATVRYDPNDLTDLPFRDQETLAEAWERQEIERLRRLEEEAHRETCFDCGHRDLLSYDGRTVTAEALRTGPVGTMGVIVKNGQPVRRIAPYAYDFGDDKVRKDVPMELLGRVICGRRGLPKGLAMQQAIPRPDGNWILRSWAEVR